LLPSFLSFFIEETLSFSRDPSSIDADTEGKNYWQEFTLDNHQSIIIPGDDQSIKTGLFHEDAYSIWNAILVNYLPVEIWNIHTKTSTL